MSGAHDHDEHRSQNRRALWADSRAHVLVPEGEDCHARRRELDEELGIKVTHACLAPFVFASHAYENFHLMMPLYLCRRWEGLVTAKEHEALAWVKPTKLADYPMPPADAPLVAWLRDLL